MTLSRWRLLLGVLVIPFMGCAGQHLGKEQEMSLNEVLDRIVSTRNDVLIFDSWPSKFSEICKISGVPCGVEESPADPITETVDGGETFHFYSQNVTVRHILDRIIAQHPAYRWSFDNGVLNIVPVYGGEYIINDKVALDIQIEPLSMVGMVPGVAAHKICEHAGIVSENGRSVIVTPVRVSRNPPILNLHLRQMTVREALNQIAKSDPRVGFWKFYIHREEKLKEYRIEYIGLHK